MKKILYGIATALILITIILACTNPGMQDFKEYVKKKDLADSSSHYTLSRENYYIYSTHIRSGGGGVDELRWSYHERYIAIFGRFHLYEKIIAD